MKPLLLIGLFVCFTVPAFGQFGCSTRGQTPESAFPVCGTAVFHQEKVPACINGLIPVTGCSFDDIRYEDQSPYWYKFTCFKSGTLGFLIDPVDDTDDYDWQLFDVTGRDPETVYTDPSLFVAANWSGEDGKTGAASGAESLLVCATLKNSPYRPLFSQMPEVKKGHHYLLLVSHFRGSTQSGYKLSFGGGTAVITDTAAPRLKRAIVACDGRSATIYLNKAMKCGSLAGDGSDFKLLYPGVSIDSAYSKACSDGFDMDQLTLVFDGKLPPGAYTVAVKEGSDQNTLLDNCGNAIPEGDTLQFVLPVVPPTPMDSVRPVGCAPQKIHIVFAGPIRCNSIASDGSDFEIEDSNTQELLKILGAKAIHCENNLSRIVEVDLAKPIYQKGVYRLMLRKGKDGNSILNECEVPSVTRQTLIFQSYDTVSAVIHKALSYKCNEVEVRLSNPGGNEINEWHWRLSNGQSGEKATIAYTDTSFQNQRIELTVSNGVCSDYNILKLSFNQDYYLRAAFEEPEFVCPQDPVLFKDISMGDNIREWKWNFGNGQTFFGADPGPQNYPVAVRTEDYPVALIVTNSKGCADTAFQKLKVINTCVVHVPTAFTPNHDGQNDYLYPLNAYLAENLTFQIYNRYGQIVFQTRDWTKKWDGTFKGKKQPPGSYVWMLRFTNKRTGQKVFRKGATLLIR